MLSAFVALLTQTKVEVAICIFIDGLDEFDGRYHAVVKIIDSLADQTFVKICLSSRPLLDFEKAFAGRPSLRLQELTFDSIRAYARVQLFESIEQRVSNGKYDRERATKLCEKIVYQAGGVFLWAVIVIRDVHDGLQDVVDLAELERVIQNLPEDVESLYVRMLNQIKPAYRRDAARFLQIVLNYSGYGLDLLKLYFIDTQRVSHDLPLDYKRVDTNALVEACHALKTQLLSHTSGLLDLNQTRRIRAGYFERVDCDQILFTKIDVLHRTVKDFLLQNTAAKSFLAAAGSSEEHLRLSIARGTFAHLDYLSQWHSETPDFRAYAKIFSLLESAMMQVSNVESLVGAAQSKLMRSLDAFSFTPKVRDLKLYSDLGIYYPFILRPFKDPYDLIGMAAASGMLHYICRILNLSSVESQAYHEVLLNCQRYTAKPTVQRTLSWIVPVRRDLHYSSYREQLRQYLRWKEPVEKGSTDDGVDCDTLAETYLLACCQMRFGFGTLENTLRLIQVLLQAGADPMVQFQKPRSSSERIPYCFWTEWQGFLRQLIRQSLAERPKGEFGNGFILPARVTSQVKLDDIFKVTKALLAQGADINHQTKDSLSFVFKDSRLEVSDEFQLEVFHSAMLLFNQVFNAYTEFRDFAAAVDSLVKRPLRKIVLIYSRGGRFLLNAKPVKAFPNDEESDILWPLIEKYHKSRQRHDKDALTSAIKWVWRAHHPDIHLSEDLWIRDVYS